MVLQAKRGRGYSGEDQGRSGCVPNDAERRVKNHGRNTTFRSLDLAIREKDERTRRELETATRRLEQEMGRVQNDSQKLASQYMEEKQGLEKRVQDITEAARQAEMRTAEHKEKMQNLRTRLDQSLSETRVIHEVEYVVCVVM
ncbi:hypothetical protein D9619_009214 [Psilocybe cf. subviscida]|uniref:Uncharacterized protein n=1 Tax=Psilocybe cf. subviscida TaxID=2480587 RepID=A0A8H5BVZ0_9AGAR|nr:hypothetical protein D9619_009214 [Psilocybe cf. subviscida]